jgi:hypothetical protein
VPPAGPGLSPEERRLAAEAAFLFLRPFARRADGGRVFLVSIFNRRNALFGWLAWTFAKQAAKRKARSQLQPDEGHRGMSAAAAATIAAAVGGLLFWRRRSRTPGADHYEQ